MKKIVLLCAMGVSTGLLVEKMKKAAVEANYDCSIEAHSVDDFDIVTEGADLVLLGPQVSYACDDLMKDNPNMLIEPIDMLDYGTMNGKNVIQHCMKVTGN